MTLKSRAEKLAQKICTATNGIRHDYKLSEIESAFTEVAAEARLAALDEVEKIATRYAEAAKIWGFKCDMTPEIYALKESPYKAASVGIGPIRE